jgi:pectate lyase
MPAEVKSSFMQTRLIAFAITTALLQITQAAVTLPFYDAFNYSEGNLAANGAPDWAAGGSSTTALEIAVSNSAALTAPPGFPAASGNGVRRAPGGSARRAVLQYNSVTNTVGNTVYVSFLLNVQTSPGAAQIICNLDDTASSDSTPAAGIFVDDGPKVGIGKNVNSPGFTMATNLGSGTHLVVARYTFQTGNDKVDLWVDPASSDYGAVSAPASLGSTTNSGDPTFLDYFQAVTPGTAGSVMFLDELRIGTTWADVTSSGVPPPSPTNTPPYITNSVLTIDGLELSGTNGMPNAYYRVLTASNVASSLDSWTPVVTNIFDGGGNFDCTVGLEAGAGAAFYSLLVPGGGTTPYINGQPQDQTVVRGQNAVFNLAAGGTAPLNYQWYFNGGTLLAGGTNSTLTVTNAQTDDAGDYFAVIDNGIGALTSVPATLFVIVPPSLTSQPQSQTLSAGQDATFDVIASGSLPLHYQWYFNTNTLLTNATNDTLVVTNVQTLSAGKYSVVVTNLGGSITSVLAVLTVNTGPSAPDITTEPQDQTIVIGQNASFSVLASGSVPLHYQWFFNTNTLLLNATNSSLTITNAQTTNAGGYSVIVTNHLGADTSVVARLTVNAPATNSGLIGYAGYNGTTTGGAGGSTVTVSNGTDFATQVSSTGSKIVRVVGTITLTGNVKPKNNKTIVGVGTNATIIGDLDINKATNIIVQNLTFSNPSGVGDGDGVTIEYSERVWVDHCTFVDCKDGSLDTTHGSDWVTVSWCKFYYVNQTAHRFACLVGHSDSNSSEDAGKLHVTFHHNWWSTKVTERMPRTRFGRIHVFNNYFNAPGNNYCVRASIQSEVLVENNYFENISTPYEYLSPNGKIRAVGNKTVNCSNVDPFADSIFTPPYAYVLQTPDEAKASVVAGAGAGTGLFP